MRATNSVYQRDFSRALSTLYHGLPFSGPQHCGGFYISPSPILLVWLPVVGFLITVGPLLSSFTPCSHLLTAITVLSKCLYSNSSIPLKPEVRGGEQQDLQGYPRKCFKMKREAKTGGNASEKTQRCDPVPVTTGIEEWLPYQL